MNLAYKIDILLSIQTMLKPNPKRNKLLRKNVCISEHCLTDYSNILVFLASCLVVVIIIVIIIIIIVIFRSIAQSKQH